MAVNEYNYKTVLDKVKQYDATLVAVSKIKPVSDIRSLCDLGQKDFGENYVQELVEKHAALPGDIRWHFIGHLQSNKVKYIASFVHLIHGVDTEKLLIEINKQAKKHNRVIRCLLQVHIAQEETKYGFDATELTALLSKINEGILLLDHIHIQGLMGMASFTDDKEQLKQEFSRLRSLYDQAKQDASSAARFETLSMGMSGDYELALHYGSTMVRIGSLLFGARI